MGDLLAGAAQVRDEFRTNANTSARVGGLLVKFANAVEAVSNVAALRSVEMWSCVVHLLGQTTVGDGGGGYFRPVTGASPGTYVDDGVMTVVPTGGNGSAAWLRVLWSPGEYNLRWWGAFGDGVTVETTPVQAALNYVKLNGGTLVVPAGTYLVAALALGSGTARWGIRGAGKGRTIFKRSSGGTAMNCSGSSVPFTLEHFTLNGNYAAVPTSASHGMSIGLVSGVRVQHVSFTDWKSSACQIYDDGGTHRYSDNVMVDCDAAGSGAEVGFLIANMDKSGFVRCRATGCTTAPGYAIEFKNVCEYCFVTDCEGSSSIAGGAFGNDSGVTGVQYCTVTGFTGYNNTTAGFISAYSRWNVFSNMTFDMNGTDGFAIRSETGDQGNSYANVAARNIKSTRSGAFFTGDSQDNYLQFSHIDNLNTTGTVVEFGSSTNRNRVVLERMTTPNVRAAGLDTEATFNSSTTNSYEHRGYTMFENVTIASDTATSKNAASQLLILAGEGGLADNLATITTGNSVEGRVLALRTASGAAAITVNNAGNIAPAGGASFTLDGQPDTMSVRFQAGSSKWGEIARANNG